MASENFAIKGVLSVTDQMSNVLKGAMSSLDNFASKTQSSMQNASNSVNSMAKGLKIGGAAITALGVSSLKSFGDFEASLNKAAVVAGGTSKDIKGLADEANKMGAELPLSAQDAADAMVAMAQDGASIGTIKEEFPAIAKAATAAGADLQTTASVVQQSMNIWGKSLESPAQAASILTQTANMSNASIEDMQQALATIGGTATNAGISMQDTSTAIGLLTNKGFSAAQASQDLNHALLQIQAPSKVAQKEMTALGISYTDAEGNMKSFPTILGEINTALEGMKPAEKAKAMKALFGTAGMGAMLPLLDSIKDKSGSTTTSWEAFSDSLQKNAGSNTAALKSLDDQAAEMQKNLGSKIEQVGGNWESLRNSAMQASSGVNGAILDMINNLLNMGTNSDTAFGKIAQGFVGFSTIIGPAMTATGALVGSFNQLVTGSSNLGKAFKALASPQMVILAGLALLAAGFMLAYKNSEPFRNAVNNIASALQSGFNSAIQLAQDVLGKLGIHIQSTSDLMTALTGALKSPVAGFTAMGAGVVLLLGALGVLPGPISLVKNLFGSLGGIFTKLLPSFGSTGDKAVEMTGKLTQSGGSAKQASTMFSGFSGAVLKIGTAIGIAAAGLGVFAFGIAAIAAQGQNGIDTISSLSMGITMIIAVLAICSPLLRANASGLDALGNNALKVGAAIAIASLGFAVFTAAITQLASTGTSGVIAVAAITVAIIALAATFAILGPALTENVVGIVGFGAAIALIGVGIGVATAGIAALILAFVALTSVTSQIPAALTAVGVGATAMMVAILTGVVANVALITAAFTAMGAAILTSIITLAPLIGQAFLIIAQTILMTLATLLPQIIALIGATIVQILAMLVAIMPQIQTFLISLGTMIIGVLTALLPQVLALLGSLIIQVLTMLVTLAPQITALIVQIFLAILATITAYVPQIVAGIVALLVAIMAAIGEQTPAIVAAFLLMLTDMVEALIQMTPLMLQILTAMLVAMVAVVASYQSAFGKLGMLLLKALGMGLIGQKVDVVGKASDIMKESGTGAAKAGMDAFDKAGGNSAKNAIKAIANKNSDAKTTGGKLSSSAAKGMDSKKAEAKTAGTNVGNAGKSGAESTKGSWRSVGSNLAAGLAAGISAGRSDAVNAARSIARDAVNAAKAEAKIHSPSRVMKYEVGKYLALGMAVGMTSYSGAVQNAAQGLADNAIPDIRPSQISDSINATNKQLQTGLQANIDSKLSVGSQPANISLQMGNTVYGAFVDDVTKQQSTATSLRIDRRF